MSKRKKKTEPTVETNRLYMCRMEVSEEAKEYLREHNINHITRNGTLYMAVNGTEALQNLQSKFEKVTMR